LQVFDSWAGELSPSSFKEFSLPYLNQIPTRLQELFASTCPPIVIFAKGAHESINKLSQSGYSVIGLDWAMDPITSRKKVNEQIILQGNADPCVLYGSKDTIRQNVQEMVKQFGMKRWIANLGHGIYPGN